MRPEDREVLPLWLQKTWDPSAVKENLSPRFLLSGSTRPCFQQQQQQKPKTKQENQTLPGFDRKNDKRAKGEAKIQSTQQGSRKPRERRESQRGMETPRTEEREELLLADFPS